MSGDLAKLTPKTPVAREGHQIDVGARLRDARLVRGLSQRELARRAGVTNGTVSQIEQNATSPSVASLKRLLDAMKMTLGDFFSDPDEAAGKVFFKAGERRELSPEHLLGRLEKSAAHISLQLIGQGKDHAIQMLYETYPPGSSTGAELYTHEGEECGIVISGSIQVQVADQTATLGTGDSYYFKSTAPHGFRNKSDEPCIVVSACTPPTF